MCVDIFQNILDPKNVTWYFLDIPELMSALQAKLPSIVEGDGGRKSCSVWIETSDPKIGFLTVILRMTIDFCGRTQFSWFYNVLYIHFIRFCPKFVQRTVTGLLLKSQKSLVIASPVQVKSQTSQKMSLFFLVQLMVQCLKSLYISWLTHGEFSPGPGDHGRGVARGETRHTFLTGTMGLRGWEYLCLDWGYTTNCKVFLVDFVILRPQLWRNRCCFVAEIHKFAQFFSGPFRMSPTNQATFIIPN